MFSIRTFGIPKLQYQLSLLPPFVRKEANQRIKDILKRVQREARENASWSSRIPGSIRVTLTKRGGGLRAGGVRAPHARPYEGITGNRTFRHPVFGNRSTWVTQQTRPFIMPAVEAEREEVTEEAEEAVRVAARQAGFFA